MRYFDAGFWSDHFQRVYVAQIRAFERAVIERLMPAFEGIEEEAEQLANDEYDRLGRLPGDENVDMGDLAESAQDAGLAHYQEITAVRQSLLNLCATALFHLFEQQLLTYHRRHLLHPSEENDPKLFNRTMILERFQHGGVIVEHLPSWRGICELEALANTVKHGAGRSSNILRDLRPGLLVFPLFRGQPGLLGRPLPDVHMPLAGDDVFVTEADFGGFANIVVAFWSELADAIQEVG
jgi:hypothetical protein